MSSVNKLETLKNNGVKKRIAEEVVKQQSYLVGIFTKTSIPDLVVTQWAAVSLSNPKFLKYIARQLSSLIKSSKYDLVCGIETAGISLASAVSMETDIPWIYARKERKDSGSRRAFEGTYKKGNKVVFVDNFSATGKGMVDIINNAKKDGLVYSELFVIVDNEWEKVKKFNESLKTFALITNNELTDYLNVLGYFPGKIYEYCKMYLDDPSKLKLNSNYVKAFREELNKYSDLPYIIK